MEGVTNKIYHRPKYKSTVNGAVAGAVTGAAVSGAFAGVGALTKTGIKILPIDQKRKLVVDLQQKYTKQGYDMARTTVSKVFKINLKTITKPSMFLKVSGILALAGAGIGAGVGLAVDLIKNHKAKKEAMPKYL